MRQKPPQRCASSLDAEIGMADQSVRVDAGGPQRSLATRGLLLRRQIEARPRGVADVTMPEVEQVLRRALAGVNLVDADRGNAQVVERTVDEDHPGPLLDEPRVVVVLAAHVRHLAGDEDHSVHLSVEQHVDVVHLPERSRRGRTEDRGEPGFGGPPLDCLGKLGEDRVLEVRKEEADDSGLGPAARRDVEELSHRPLDALARFRANVVQSARNAGGRGDADTGLAGYISKAGHCVAGLCNRFSAGTPAFSVS